MFFYVNRVIFYRIIKNGTDPSLAHAGGEEWEWIETYSQ